MMNFIKNRKSAPTGSAKYSDPTVILLAGFVGIALLAAIFVRTFFPRVILPSPELRAVLILSLAALTTGRCIFGEIKRDLLTPIGSALIFGLLPLAAGYVAPIDALKLALLGAVTFTASALVFDSINDRIAPEPSLRAKLSAIVSAIGIFLAAQGIMGIF